MWALSLFSGAAGQALYHLTTITSPGASLALSLIWDERERSRDLNSSPYL